MSFTIAEDVIKPLPPPLHSIDHYAKFEEEFGVLIEGIVDMFREDREDQDVQKVHGAENQIRGALKEWNGKVDVKKDEMRELTRSHKQLLLTSARSRSQPSTAEHEARMASSQADLLAALKNNSELERERNRLQAEVERIRREIREDEGDAIDVEALNAEVMRIKLYREFGFTPLAEEKGSFNKIIVRSKASSDVRTILTDSKSPDFFWSNYLWESLSA